MGKPKIKQITLTPWAKVNLYLKVLSKRSDGYHEICTLIHPIALFDELIIKYTEAVLTVNCKLTDLPNRQNILPQKDNLITKAVNLFFRKIGKPPLVEVNLTKRIPVGGGLGGGSSDAACTLTGLNKLFGYPLTGNILYELCLKLGMDVPFFLKPKPALCIGRGDIIEKRYNSMKFFCVLVNPGKSLPTKDVYEMLNLTLTERATMDNISNFANIKDINEIASYIENDLEGPAIKLYPEIRSVLELLKSTGSVKSFVCGSGSTVCGLVSNRREAEEVMSGLRRQGSKDWWTKVVSSL